MNEAVWTTSKGSPSQRQGPLHWRGKYQRFLLNSNLQVTFICLISESDRNPLELHLKPFHRFASLNNLRFSRSTFQWVTQAHSNVYSKANAQLHLCSTKANKASHSDSLWCGNFLSSFEIPRNLWTSENLPHLKSISRAFRLFGYSLVSNLPL